MSSNQIFLLLCLLCSVAYGVLECVRCECTYKSGNHKAIMVLAHNATSFNETCMETCPSSHQGNTSDCGGALCSSVGNGCSGKPLFCPPGYYNRSFCNCYAGDPIGHCGGTTVCESPLLTAVGHVTSKQRCRCLQED
eukprot:TRINITY_DN66738_c3_g1_i1.p1 TRINITY_DN66738_c3_g1~~TRINITY_DN66738_c3_g1_i1.p1  ORF type:complete len:137 (+),score=8.53 TRINITY_DN66738_c3_g1_i1:30-440(+)